MDGNIDGCVYKCHYACRLYNVTIYMSYNLEVVVSGSNQLQLSSSNLSKSFLASSKAMELYESGKAKASFMNNKKFSYSKKSATNATNY